MKQAKFYFQYRGPSSQFTWDWVLSFKPGDRKILPRMPMVEIKEKRHIQVVKAPFRVAAAVIAGSGRMVESLGHGLIRVSQAVKLGNRSEWVAEADIKANKKTTLGSAAGGNVTFATSKPKKMTRVFNEKGGKVWSDNDSVASTEAGSMLNEKTGRDLL